MINERILINLTIIINPPSATIFPDSNSVAPNAKRLGFNDSWNAKRLGFNDSWNAKRLGFNGFM